MACNGRKRGDGLRRVGWKLKGGRVGFRKGIFVEIRREEEVVIKKDEKKDERWMWTRAGGV